MSRLKSLWRKLLRPLGVGQPRRPHWVEPANAVTRAIYEGKSFVTMAAWEQPAATFVPGAPAPIDEGQVPEQPSREPAAPKRPGVAA